MMRQEGQLLEAFWSNEEQARKHCHVATSPRRDVTKSRRGGQLLLKSTFPTSRRHHVATSPRRDVTTSRRLLKILHLIIKCEGLGNQSGLEGVRPETRNWRPANTDWRILLGFLYWILFIYLVIFGLYDGVFHTLYFVSLLHDVLNSLLGLHQTLSQTMD